MIKQFIFLAALASLTACNLTNDVDIELPEYERQPVVECYLEPGKPFRLLLSQSYEYFDNFGLDSSFLERTLLNDALVTITYNGKTDTLYNQLSFETSPIKLFNYTGANLVPETPGIDYQLNIILPNNGGNITATTTMLPKVPIDSVVYSFNPDPNFDTLARVLTYITDDQSQTNYYRRLLNYASLDSFPDQDFLVTDRFSVNPVIAFGTGYDLTEGDTVFNAIFHITRDYYDYTESVQLAVVANLNPFAQPSPIKSNVSGKGNPLGIFTCLVYDRDTTIIGQ
ncbi:MAG: DUF4249 domain-containing protein [Saprospiraceae bacterium]|nr:DUF4249 domain-containing protein [Saprospiraceae bacterium]